MKGLIAIAAASLGLLWASGTASATPLAPISSAPSGYESFDGAVEQVHYRRRAVRRYHSGPAISFGFAPFVSPYAYPYHSAYSYRRAYSPYAYGYPAYGYPSYGYGYPYGYGSGISFGFNIR